MLAVKQKVRRHFMKRGDNVSKGGNHWNNFLFSFFTSKFQSYFVSRMSVKESIVEKLQISFRKKL
jgi:hypothetical protein